MGCLKLGGETLSCDKIIAAKLYSFEGLWYLTFDVPAVASSSNKGKIISESETLMT